MAYKNVTEIDSKSVTAAAATDAPTTTRIDLPQADWLAAIEVYMSLTITDSGAGAITIVNTTLGAIPLVDHIQLKLTAKQTVLDVSGQQLDYWQHIDHPGMERFAQSDATSGAADGWPAVLHYRLTQSEVNLLGAIPLWLYNNVQVVITWADLNAIATSANTTSLTGTVRLVGELFDQAQPLGQNSASVASMVHSLTTFQVPITDTKITTIKLDSYNGSLLERCLLLPQNNSAATWSLFDYIELKDDLNTTREKLYSDEYQSRQRREMGSSDIPITGLYVIDRRRAADRDIIALGSAAAPDPRIDVDVPSGTTLTNAICDVVMETLIPTNHNPKSFVGMS